MEESQEKWGRWKKRRHMLWLATVAWVLIYLALSLILARKPALLAGVSVLLFVGLPIAAMIAGLLERSARQKVERLSTPSPS